MSEDISPAMIGSRSPLPLELMEQIFSELSFGDWQSLKACSLLSHNFITLTRKHLFRDVTIALEPDLSSNDEHVEAEKQNSAFQFLSFLASDPDVASFICNMRIHRPSNSIDASASGWLTASRKLATILPKLTHLHHLTVQSSFLTDWTISYDRLREVLIRFYQIPTLQHLELHHLGVTQEELLSFTGVPRLTLIGLYPKPDSTTSSSALESRGSSKAAAEHAASFTKKLSLNDLSITLKDPETATHMFGVARAAATTLKSFKWLSSLYQESQDTCINKVDLQSLPSLIFFAVCVPLEGSSILELASLFTCVGEESRLQVVEIVCDYQNLPDDDIMSAWAWERLDEALASPLYSALRQVKITAKEMIFPKHRPSRDHEDHSHEASSLFQDRLPMVRKRGLFLDI